jgi:hypothetical protein
MENTDAPSSTNSRLPTMATLRPLRQRMPTTPPPRRKSLSRRLRRRLESNRLWCDPATCGLRVSGDGTPAAVVTHGSAARTSRSVQGSLGFRGAGCLPRITAGASSRATGRRVQGVNSVLSRVPIVRRSQAAPSTISLRRRHAALSLSSNDPVSSGLRATGAGMATTMSGQAAPTVPHAKVSIGSLSSGCKARAAAGICRKVTGSIADRASVTV